MRIAIRSRIHKAFRESVQVERVASGLDKQAGKVPAESTDLRPCDNIPRPACAGRVKKTCRTRGTNSEAVTGGVRYDVMNSAVAIRALIHRIRRPEHIPFPSSEEVVSFMQGGRMESVCVKLPFPL